MKKLGCRLAAVAVAFALCGAAVYADAAAELMAGADVGVGARALAMGGAHVAAVRDATATYWNPAAAGRTAHFNFGSGVTARTDNLDVEDFGDLADYIAEEDLDVAGFNKLSDIATKAAGNPLEARLSAIAGIGVGNVAASYLVKAAGTATLTPSTAGTVETIDATGNAMGYAAAVVAFSKRMSERTTWGISIKKMQALDRRYRGTFQMDTSTTPPTVTTVRGVDDRSIKDNDTGVDFGVLIRQPDNTVIGITVQNLNTPGFNFVDPGPPMTTRKMHIEPSVHVGIARLMEDGMGVAAFDLHNINFSNGAGLSFHFGLERRVGDFLELRGGMCDAGLTGGLGLNFGFLHLDVATGPNYKSLASFGGSLAW